MGRCLSFTSSSLKMYILVMLYRYISMTVNLLGSKFLYCDLFLIIEQRKMQGIPYYFIGHIFERHLSSLCNCVCNCAYGVKTIHNWSIPPNQ